MLAFDYQTRTRIVLGVGALTRLGELAVANGARHVLLVTDAGIVAAGHTRRAVRFSEEAGCRVTVFDDVHENPTTRDVMRCLEVAKQAEIDFFVGLGGGSSMDTAKGCNFLLTNGGQMRDYQGIGKAHSPMLPLIAVPTTAGTGSECQSYALIADEETHQKMACGDPKAAARVALLDPELTVTQPRAVAACTGLDALSHAIESAVTTKRNDVSLLFSREAFRLLETNLERVLSEPDNLEARGAMQLGAAWAGTAIENSMLGAAHSAANPLTAHFNVIHGFAVGIMLPYIIRFNAQDSVARAEYKALGGSAEELAARVEELLRICGAPRTLRECSVTHESISMLAREAAAQWTATFNPRAIAIEDFEQLYELAL